LPAPACAAAAQDLSHQASHKSWRLSRHSAFARRQRTLDAERQDLDDHQQELSHADVSAYRRVRTLLEAGIPSRIVTCHSRPASPPGRAQSPGPANHTTPTEAARHCLDVHEEFLVVLTAAVLNVCTSFGLIFQVTRTSP
jgi:hypothetical protein